MSTLSHTSSSPIYRLPEKLILQVAYYLSENLTYRSLQDIKTIYDPPEIGRVQINLRNFALASRQFTLCAQEVLLHTVIIRCPPIRIESGQRKESKHPTIALLLRTLMDRPDLIPKIKHLALLFNGYPGPTRIPVDDDRFLPWAEEQLHALGYSSEFEKTWISKLSQMESSDEFPLYATHCGLLLVLATNLDHLLIRDAASNKSSLIDHLFCEKLPIALLGIPGLANLRYLSIDTRNWARGFWLLRSVKKLELHWPHCDFQWIDLDLVPYPVPVAAPIGAEASIEELRYYCSTFTSAEQTDWREVTIRLLAALPICRRELKKLVFWEDDPIFRNRIADDEIFAYSIAGFLSGISALFPSLESLTLPIMRFLNDDTLSKQPTTLVHFKQLRHVAIPVITVKHIMAWEGSPRTPLSAFFPPSIETIQLDTIEHNPEELKKWTEEILDLKTDHIPNLTTIKVSTFYVNMDSKLYSNTVLVQTSFELDFGDELREKARALGVNLMVDLSEWRGLPGEREEEPQEGTDIESSKDLCHSEHSIGSQEKLELVDGGDHLKLG